MDGVEMNGGPVFIGRTWTKILGLGFLILLICSISSWADDFKPAPDERQQVEQAARAYLEAEVNRDLTAVYKSLYPDSDYCRANDFQAYLAEARSSPVRIKSFTIRRILIFEENPEKTRFPRLEGFARVEVDLMISYTDTKGHSAVNYDFPFVKEKGVWYKL
jgi:hypothetical protein